MLFERFSKFVCDRHIKKKSVSRFPIHLASPSAYLPITTLMIHEMLPHIKTRICCRDQVSQVGYSCFSVKISTLRPSPTLTSNSLQHSYILPLDFMDGIGDHFEIIGAGSVVTSRTSSLAIK